MLCPNTPAFLESIFGIPAAGGVVVRKFASFIVCCPIGTKLTIISHKTKTAANYRLKQEDIAYIFSHADVDVIIADEEFLNLLDAFRKEKPHIPVIVDTDTDAVEGELNGPFDDAVLEGLTYDAETGDKGWDGLDVHPASEDDVIALPFTSGTTARPKGVEFTHRGCYLAAMANVVESGLNFHTGRCRYLWTLPMFHAMGEFRLFYYFFFLCSCIKEGYLTWPRLDIPLVSDGSPRDALLPTKNRLPQDLAIAEGGTHHALQRRPDSQHSSVQRQRGRTTPRTSPCDCRSQSTYTSSLRANDESQPASCACLWNDRDLRPHYQGLLPARMGRSTVCREVPEDGATRTRLRYQSSRAGDQD